ncbi:MAG: caspase family protein [Parvibaculaceae bacterium]
MRTTILAVLSMCMLLAQSAYAAAEKRVALVLGLSAYREVPTLTNPVNDATDVATKLKSIGFEVVEGYDLDHGALTAKLREFSKAMIGADAALFYYSGHGIQANGSNYLAPVDTKLSDPSDIDFELVKLDLITDQMQIAQSEKTLKVGLVFLDACRNNPLTRSLKSTSRSTIGAGLAKIQDAPSGMLIAFSTQPGNVALDGVGRNSPFTKAVLANMDKPNQSIGDMLIQVRTEVMKETDSKQVPWENSSLTGQFYFNPVKVAEVAPQETKETKVEKPEIVETKQVLTVDDSALDVRFWESISTSTNPAMFAAYLKRFPNGNFADLALVKLEEFGQKRAIAVEEATTTPKQPVAQQPVAEVQKAESQEPVIQKTESAPATATPAQSTQVASLGEQPTTAVAEPVAVNPADLQRELQRVGCYGGAIDGDWGRGSRRAMQLFNANAKTAYAVEEPSSDALTGIRTLNTQICAPTPVAEEPAPVLKRKKAAVETRQVIRCRRGEVFHEGECIRVKKRRPRPQPEVVEEDFEPAPRPRRARVGVGVGIGVPGPFSIGIGF